MSSCKNPILLLHLLPPFPQRNHQQHDLFDTSLWWKKDKIRFFRLRFLVSLLVFFHKFNFERAEKRGECWGRCGNPITDSTDLISVSLFFANCIIIGFRPFSLSRRSPRSYRRSVVPLIPFLIFYLMEKKTSQEERKLNFKAKKIILTHNKTHTHSQWR